MSLWLVIYLLFPVLNAMARCLTRHADEQGYPHQPGSLPIWAGIVILLSLNRLASMAFS